MPSPQALPGHLGNGQQRTYPDAYHAPSAFGHEDLHQGQQIDAVASPTGSASTPMGGDEAGSSSTSHGGRISSTWCCNPQFRLSVRKAAEVVVCVAQQDPRVAHRGHVPKRLRKKSIGMQIVASAETAAGRLWSIKSGDVVASLEATPQREVVVTFTAQPGKNYTIIPHSG